MQMQRSRSYLVCVETGNALRGHWKEPFAAAATTAAADATAATQLLKPVH